MIAINIVQAFWIDHLHTLAWILGFPFAIFVVLLALVTSRTAIGFCDIRTAWQAADVTERTAWFGVILSIVKLWNASSRKALQTLKGHSG
jgi:hypothetical protein